MLYSKNGSIPKPETDGTEGWIEVPDEPVAPEGKEVVWWYPPGWVIRDPMPVKAGFKYNWSQSELKWVEYAVVNDLNTIVISTGTGMASGIIFATAIDSSFASATDLTLASAIQINIDSEPSI